MRLILLVVLAAALVLAPDASADLLTPESGPSENANDIDTLYKITLYIGLIIFLLVECVLVYSLIKFRARRHGPEAAQIRGNTPLEISWTIGAALILVMLATVTFVFLPGIKDPPSSKADALEVAEGVDFATINQKEPPDGSALKISVNSQQYIWRYDYEGSGGPALQLLHALRAGEHDGHARRSSRRTSSTPGGCRSWAGR